MESGTQPFDSAQDRPLAEGGDPPQPPLEKGGEPEADWIAELRRQCEPPSSQAKVAEALEVSATMVSLVLKGNYPHDTSRLEGLVRGAYMAETVECPILGEISKKDCLGHQKRPFASSNPLRVALYRACRTNCPHSLIQ